MAGLTVPIRVRDPAPGGLTHGWDVDDESNLYSETLCGRRCVTWPLHFGSGPDCERCRELEDAAGGPPHATYGETD